MKDGTAGKMTTFVFNAELMAEFKKVCQREGKTMKSHLEEFMREHVKLHGEGNPNYKLSKWDDPNFKMTPAFGESLVNKWKPYLVKCTKQELKDMIDQADAISKESKRRLYD